MKTYVVGSGGVGGYLGGLLAKSGKDVTFLARGEHYHAMVEEGLKVKSVPGDFEVKPARVIDRISDIANPDLIIFSVKTYDTDQITKELKSVVNKDTIVISFQNGVDHDQQIKNRIPGGNVYPGVAYLASAKTRPGLIEQTGGLRKFIFGDRHDPDNPRLKEVEKYMREAGADALASTDIVREIWKKFVFIIAFSGMTSICRSPIGRVLGDPIATGLFERCAKEAIKVAQSMGARVEERAFENIMTNSRNFPPDSKSSLLVDIENHRRTEIETLHGSLVRLARSMKIDVPINEMIYGTIKLWS